MVIGSLGNVPGILGLSLFVVEEMAPMIADWLAARKLETILKIVEDSAVGSEFDKFYTYELDVAAHIRKVLHELEPYRQEDTW